MISWPRPTTHGAIRLHRMNQNLQLKALPTPEQIARTATLEWVGLLRRRPDRAVPFGIALSGGRIARSFYEAVIANTGERRDEFATVHFFWADERCVPPSDPENN